VRNDTRDILAAIDAVTGDTEQAAPAVHVTEEGVVVTEEAVTEAALNPMAGLQVPQVAMRYDPVLGRVPADLDETAAQDWVAAQAAEREQAAPEIAPEPEADETELREQIIADSLSSPEAQAGMANWQRELEQRRREQQAREQAREMAEEIRSYLARYLVFPEALRNAQLGTMTLWAIHTYSIKASGVTPYLAVVAPTKGSGKSTVLEILSTLVGNPSPLGVTPTAPVIRLLAAETRTIFLDEIDTLTKGAAGGDIAAVLNSGYKAGGAVMRVARAKGGSFIDQSNTFCAKAMAGIAPEGELPLPAATQDRCIQIRITRAKAGELSTRFRVDVMRDDPEVVAMRDWAQTWSYLHYREIRDTRTAMPELSSSRAEQIWEPLITVADLLGGEWAAQAREWAQALDGQREQATDPNVAFVNDVKVAVTRFLGDNPGARTIPVETLVKLRNDLDERQVTQVLSPISFGKRLGAFGIKSTPVAKVRVYKLTDGDNLLPEWVELFERYAE
jgi:hypothetical protein